MAARLAVRPLLLLSVILCALTCAHAHVHTTPFALGDEVKIECRRNLTSFPRAFTVGLPPRASGAAGASGAHGAVGVGADDAMWGPGPTCHENGRELSFRFGEDGFIYCGWHLSNDDLYHFAAGVMRGEHGWQCRVPMSKDRGFYLPVPLPLWGLVEPGHMHINYHMNFIFHVDDGRIIGAAAYPMRDRFQYARVGSTVNLHGPVKWFNKHSFLAVGQATPAVEAAVARAGGGTSAVAVVLWCVMSSVVTFTALAMLYVLRLKPMLAKRYLKGD